MNNIYMYFIAMISILQIYGNVMVTFKIDSTISLINQELIESCVTEDSKLLALEYNDLSLLEINHLMLKETIDGILNDNLDFLQFSSKYYFYDNVSMINCPIGYYYCNSVQILITILYDSKSYERTLRYEPIKK